MLKILGKKVKDTISGVSGVVTSVTTFMTGCHHVGVSPTGLGPLGDPKKTVYIDLKDLEGYKELPEIDVPKLLGKKVKDKVTGYEGVATSYTRYKSVADRVGIQSNILFEGIPATPYAVDLINIECISEPKAVKQSKVPGGPREIAPPHSISIR